MDWDVKDLMLLQAAVEVVLLIVLAMALWRSRRREPAAAPDLPERLAEAMGRFVEESDRLSAAFEGNLEEKRRLTADLIDKLDRRLGAYRELLDRTGEAQKAAELRLASLGAELEKAVRLQSAEPKANPGAPEVRAMVLQLARRGLSVEDIAVKSNLHRGEVELIIDLDRPGPGEPEPDRSDSDPPDSDRFGTG